MLLRGQFFNSWAATSALNVKVLLRADLRTLGSTGLVKIS